MTKFYRPEALEAIARKTLKNYDPELLYGEPAAIPIERIVQSLHLSIEYQCLRKNGIILGETIFDDTYVPVYHTDEGGYGLIYVNSGTIILDESLLNRKTDGRLRFTCAHELAHWLLHKELYSGTGQAAAFLNPKKSSEENGVTERQANILATDILMPAMQVKRAFYDIRKSCKSADPTAALAELFDVSKQAMGIFLAQHHLL